MNVQTIRGRPRLKQTVRTRSRLISRGSLHDTIAEQLRSMIEGGELAPGEQIVESSLCETFGVSRTPMREALRVMASEGLVELRPRRTPVVARLDPEEIAAVFEIMESFEALAGRRARENATPEDIEDLERMHAAMVAEHDRGDRKAYADINRAIHTRIVDLAGNPVLKASYASFSLKIHRARSTTNYDARRWEQSILEHERIMETFRSGTPEDVANALVEHTRLTGASVIATLVRMRDKIDQD